MHPRGYLRVPDSSARRLLLAVSGLALALGMLPALAGAVPGTRAVTARADDVTASLDAMRTGWDQGEDPTLIGPSAVPGFVQRFSHTVGGQVYAQPVVANGTLIVATENDYVYGLDPSTGAQKWVQHLGSAFVIRKVTKLANCHDLTPNIGVTGTPAYDAASGNVYLFANVLTGSTPHYYLYGINASTGAVAQKTQISGHPTNDSHLTFSAQQEMERPGVLVQGGFAYGAFASHCDHNPYTGYVARVSLSSHAVDLWTTESGVTYNRGGIWHAGGGIMSDPAGHIFVASGNGISPAIGPGGSPPGQLSESVIRLGLTSGNMAAKDFFSPADAPALDAADTDFGSAGPVGLPFGTTSFPDVMVQGGKEGRLFLLNRDSLGGRTSNDAGALFHTNAYGGEWGHPAVFGDTTTLDPSTDSASNDFVFNVGRTDPMRVFRVVANSSGSPVLSNIANSSLTYGFSSGSPVVTSHGNDPATAVVWEVGSSGATGANGELDAYALGSLINTSGQLSPCTSSAQCTLTPIWHASIGTASKFSIPATSNGWVYVGTRLGTQANGTVVGYALPTTAAPVQSAATTLPQTGVNSTTTKQVSITARAPITFTKASASTGVSNALAPVNQFTVGQASVTKKGTSTAVPVTFPVTLAKGDKLHVQVSFAPAAPGGANGSLTLTTSTGRIRVVPLTGTGVKTGLYASPGSLTFPLSLDQGVIPVPVGLSVFQEVAVINGGTATETVSSVSRPTGPFQATGLPAAGDKITPGESFVVQLIFSPSQTGPAKDSLTINLASGRHVTVPLSGIGTASVSKVVSDQPAISFGSVPVGNTGTMNIHITNVGNIPSDVTVPNPPSAPFHSLYQVAKGLPFNPGYDLLIPVTFTPTKTGTFTAPYTLVWTDRLGKHSLTVKLTGTGI